VPDTRQRAYLEAMGIPLWEPRDAVGTGLVEAPPAEGPAAEAVGEIPAEPLAGAADAAPVAAISESRVGSGSGTTSEAPALLSPEPRDLDWDGLQQAVSGCRQCDLCDSRTQTVFGVGDRQARLMLIGEAPGADEDRLGEPFVGRAGQLLTAMLAAIGFTREQVYIANVLKCRPPGNRDPHVDEVAACRAYLDRQIELIQPRLILSLGGVSAKNLLDTDQGVGRLRGRLHHYPASGTPLRVTYHPAFLLRRPEEKAKAWVDLQQAWADLHGSAAL